MTRCPRLKRFSNELVTYTTVRTRFRSRLWVKIIEPIYFFPSSLGSETWLPRPERLSAVRCNSTLLLHTIQISKGMMTPLNHFSQLVEYFCENYEKLLHQMTNIVCVLALKVTRKPLENRPGSRGRRGCRRSAATPLSSAPQPVHRQTFTHREHLTRQPEPRAMTPPLRHPHLSPAFTCHPTRLSAERCSSTVFRAATCPQSCSVAHPHHPP